MVEEVPRLKTAAHYVVWEALIRERDQSTNVVVASFLGLAKKIGVTRFTVQRACGLLIKQGWLVKVGNCQYMLNPAKIWARSETSRFAAIDKFRRAGMKLAA
jgi:hypothetical protein